MPDTHPLPFPAGTPDASGVPSLHGVPQQGLRTDADLIEQFLRERCARSAHTEAAYRASLRRLGWFCRHIGLSSIRALQRDQWHTYQSYLRHPPAEHVMVVSVGYGQPGWAPFRAKASAQGQVRDQVQGGLSDRSAKQSEIIAKAFFQWLAEPAIGALPHSPISSIRTHTARRSATAAGTERFLQPTDWAYVDKAIEEMPRATLWQRRARARAAWVVALALRTGLRASEIAQARASDLRPSSRHRGKFNLHLVRKGGVEASIPLLDETVLAWREHLAQYELDGAHPHSAGDAPLVLPLRDADLKPPIAPVRRSHIWRIVKDAMRSAADVAMQAADAEAEARLREASTHWLRHTFANDLLDRGADLRSVRDLMDHASITTTNQYLHRPEDRLREDLEKLAARNSLSE